MSHDTLPHSSSRPLCVDLDGTLVRSDTLWESILWLLHHDPMRLVFSLLKLFKGRAAFKAYVSSHAKLDPQSLPYNAAVINLIQSARRDGRKIVLATGANQIVAQAIATHLALFDEVLASDSCVNLTGRRKAARLQSGFGSHGFDYVGNARADIPVWNLSETAYICGPLTTPSGMSCHRIVRTDTPSLSISKALLRELRPHQWLKNLLVFVPILTAHHIFNVRELGIAALTTIAFCLTSSSVYLLNDLLDLAHDRKNPAKANRPLASGALPLSIAFFLGPILLVCGLILAFSLHASAGGILVAYFIIATAYSTHLKKMPMIDVVCLALLYTGRIIIGNEVTDIPYTPWLLATALFAFLSLALMKRCAELHFITETNTKAPGRYYQKDDLSILYSMGTASAFITTLIMVLYINSTDVWNVYRHPQVLWALCPIMIFWFGRAWILTHRGQMHQDPVIFAITDVVNLWTGAIVLLTIFLAS